MDADNITVVLLLYWIFLETERIQKGYKSAEEEKLLDIEAGKPMRLTYKVSIPTEKYPNVSWIEERLAIFDISEDIDWSH